VDHRESAVPLAGFQSHDEGGVVDGEGVLVGEEELEGVDTAVVEEKERREKE